MIQCFMESSKRADFRNQKISELTISEQAENGVCSNNFKSSEHKIDDRTMKSSCDQNVCKTKVVELVLRFLKW